MQNYPVCKGFSFTPFLDRKIIKQIVWATIRKCQIIIDKREFLFLHATYVISSHGKIKKMYGKCSKILNTSCLQPGRTVQSVTYLTADTCLTADPGVPSSILVLSHTFTEIEMISMAILLPSADSRRVAVSYKQKYVHEVLVNRLVKPAQEKSVVR